MASGKSLELAAIKGAAASPRCKCGAPWSDHLRKDGQVLAKYLNPKHERVTSAGSFGMNRSQRRRMMRESRRG